MSFAGYEHLPYGGESARDRCAFDHYLADAKRGKTALQLKAIALQMTPDLRSRWVPQSFTDVVPPEGTFDALVCNVSCQFQMHGQKYGNIRVYTEAAKRYLDQHKGNAVPNAKGLIKLPLGVFDRTGRIVTFFG